MKLKVIFAVFLLAGHLIGKAQTGNYFLSNFTPADERIDLLTFGMAQDAKGVLYFANKSGVLAFDGRNWTSIATPAPIYTVTAQGKEIYAGGLKGYGKIAWGPDNTQVFQSLSQDQPLAIQIIASISTKEKIYFIAAHSLFCVSITSGKTEAVIKANAQDAFTGLFEISGTVYVGTELHGLMMIQSNKLEKASFQLPESMSVLYATTLAGTGNVLIGSTTNRLFIYNKSGLRQIKLKDIDFLETNVMVNGAWVNDKLLSIGTLRGGVLFVNPETGATEEIINYLTGLPDNEIYSIISDRNQGVWVAHDYGFTRIAPYLPFRSYSHYPGLSGNLLCAHNFNGQTYVGTTLGLFNLVRQEIYEDVPYENTSGSSGTAKSVSKRVKGFFSFFKRDKNKNSGIKSRPSSGKNTRRVLKSLQYVFRKVDGVNGKVNQITEAHGKLLASGIIGVLEIDGLKSKSITSDPVRTAFLSASLNQLLVSTLNEEVKSYALGSKGWTETHLLDTLQDDVNYIFEDKLQNIWLCGRANVLKLETLDGNIIDISNISFLNPSLDEPVGVAYGSEVYVAASGEINRFDTRQNKFLPYSSLSGSKKYFASAGYFWFYNGHYWSTVDDKMQKDLKLKWLGLFQNIRFLSPAGHGDGLWVITASNELYKFTANKIVTESGKYPLFLREVKGQQSKIVPASLVTVNQLESTVALDFIQPNYFGTRAIEYRYRVNGLNNKWTDYSSTNNVVNLSYLPIGTYNVEVQTRDIMGLESDPEKIQMKVVPPYWKQSWFYAAEFAFFGLLVFVSIKLSSANSKYRYLSGLLSVLTVIMLIQFVQTIAASQITVKNTPVVDFFVQVFIALLVLPLEGYLRKFMKGGSIRAQPATPPQS